MTIAPAYGRDYKTKAEVLAALDAGKDFLTQGLDSGYVSLSELPDGRHSVRYKKLTQQLYIKVKDGKRV